MPGNKNRDIKSDKNSENKDEIEDLKTLIEKKKVQYEALKKIIDKLIIEENSTTNK